MTSPNPPWAREASYLAASCEEVERGGSREEVLDHHIFLRNRRLISIVDYIRIITHAAFIAIIVDVVIFFDAAITIASVMFVTVVMHHYLICAVACTSGNHDVLSRK